MPPSEFLDLTYPLSVETPVYPGDAPTEIEALEAAAEPGADGVRRLNVSRLSMTLHTGTHMDAPFHFFPEGGAIDRIPVEQCMGQAWLLDLSFLGPEEEIGAHHLAGLDREATEARKLILRTGWSRMWGASEYFTGHPRITAEAADYVVRRGIHLVGVDMPSVDRAPFPAHLSLLGNGVVIVENLTNLDLLPAGLIEFCALPLKIVGRDGSPVRAIARGI